jgi:glycosyltransferase involved in cell wall biosynthesis
MTTINNILFVHYGEDWIRGSERCLLDLLTHIDQKKFKPVVWCNSFVMAEQVKQLGVTVYQSDFPILFGWQRPYFNFSGFVRLTQQTKRFIAKHNIHLIHANSGAPCQWLNSVARKKGLPLIAHLHSYYLFRDRLTLGLHQVSKAVAVSHYVLKPLLNEKMPSHRTCVIHNGIDIERLQQQSPINVKALFNFSKNTFVLAALGSLISRKGTDIIIEALAHLVKPSVIKKTSTEQLTEQSKKQSIPVQLLIIGDGPELKNLQQQVKQLTLEKYVTFVGESQNAFAYLRGGVDLLISAAREEAFGLFFAEAGLAGIPVLAPKIGGINEIVIDKKTGVLVKNLSSTTLSQAIISLYLDPEKCKKMAAAGQKNVLENFNIHKNVQHFEQLYLHCIEQINEPLPWYKNTLINQFFAKIFKRFLPKGVSYEAN